jgi:23S rRNA (cytosine1962-C5)-methyltransferase
MKKIILLPGRDKAVRNRHHWIFSGAVKDWGEFENGDILPVYSAEGEMLGSAYFHRDTSIAGRMVAFGAEEPLEAMRRNLGQAFAWRAEYFDKKKTSACRLVNSEGDNLPGLIIDRYHDVAVIQIATIGMEKLKPIIIEEIKKLKGIKAIYEKSDLASRHIDGLERFEGLIWGKMPAKVQILENGLKFEVDVVKGQKTGLFLDQREMRALVGDLSKDRKVLNCFSYTGGFSVYAAANGANLVHSVESSWTANALAQENFQLNKLAVQKEDFFGANVFDYLHKMEKGKYDLIVLDPPAFAKKKSDLVMACRGYKEINRLAFEKIAPGGLVLTCSCSYYVDEKLFQQIIFEAAAEVGRSVRIIQKHRLAPDHPINIYHPEGSYLKSLLLEVE